MKVDGVFSGGGVKAFSFIGALELVEERGFEFERVAGTSAGAIIASFIAAGYKSEEIRELFEELNLKKLLDPNTFGSVVPFLKWVGLYFKLGLYKGRHLEDWIEEKLAVKGVYTFSDIPAGSLKVIASDLTLGRILVLPDDLKQIYDVDPKTFPIAKAVRMSAGIPYFYVPEKLAGRQSQKSLIVDGGLLSNFPLWVFWKSGKKKRPILGMKLSKQLENIPNRKIKNAIGMFHALFLTMMEAHDARYISKKEAADIIFIPVENINTTDFKLSDKEKQNLMALGRERTLSFLKNWQY